MNCVINGTEYETEGKVDHSIFSDENLSVIIIDGERQNDLVLSSVYDVDDCTRFSFREMSNDEKLNKQITDTQVGLAEVYEIIASLG